MIPLEHVIGLSAILFVIGVAGVALRRNLIVVLFLFVVMLLNLRETEFAPGRRALLKLAGGLLGVFGLLQLLRLVEPGLPALGAVPPGFGGYRSVGIALYTDYVLLVELISLLLLAAIVGALILAKRKIDS